MWKRTILMAGALLWAVVGTAILAVAQPAAPDPLASGLRGLNLGLSATNMPPGFIKFACGSNGGPPLRPLRGWEEFAQCTKDPKGLYEVAVEYDNVGGHLGEMFVEMFAAELEEDLWLDQYTGTKMAGHPVILSVLFDEQGIVQGLRAVTDSRARLQQRRVSNMLAVVVRNHYDPQTWTCADLPLERGEQPVGNGYIKQRCETLYRGDRRMLVWRNFFRKAGQTGTDRFGNVVDGEFESSARWEVWSLSVAQN